MPEHPKHARISENGRNYKEFVTDFVSKEKYSKPIVASVGGITPPEERMNHADTIILGGAGTAPNKITSKAVETEVDETPWKCHGTAG